MYSPRATAGVVEPYPPVGVSRPAFTPGCSNVSAVGGAGLGVGAGWLDTKGVGLEDGAGVTRADAEAVGGIGVASLDGLGDAVRSGVGSMKPAMGVPERAAAMMTTTTPETEPMSSAVPSSRPDID
jgi:hypothetical protein